MWHWQVQNLLQESMPVGRQCRSEDCGAVGHRPVRYASLFYGHTYDVMSGYFKWRRI